MNTDSYSITVNGTSVKNVTTGGIGSLFNSISQFTQKIEISYSTFQCEESYSYLDHYKFADSLQGQGFPVIYLLTAQLVVSRSNTIRYCRAGPVIGTGGVVKFYDYNS